MDDSLQLCYRRLLVLANETRELKVTSSFQAEVKEEIAKEIETVVVRLRQLTKDRA